MDKQLAVQKSLRDGILISRPHSNNKIEFFHISPVSNQKNDEEYK